MQQIKQEEQIDDFVGDGGGNDQKIMKLTKGAIKRIYDFQE